MERSVKRAWSRQRTLLLGVSFVVTVVLTVIGTQMRAAGQARSVVKLDPSLDQIVAADARFESLKTDYFGITEGPVWIQQGRTGYLLFSDIAANAIYKWMPGGALSVFQANSGYTGGPTGVTQAGFIYFNGRLNVGTFGSNGIIVDPQGRLIFCAQGDRAIVRLEKDGKRTVLADRYNGKRLNRPNDLALKSDGAIYFTNLSFPGDPAPDLSPASVLMIKDGAVKMLIDNYPFPNGVAFSPDERSVYLNRAGNVIMRHDVQTDDTIANGRVLIDMSSDKAPGNSDGLKVDARGNVYSTGPGGIWIISPEGKHLGTILLPEPATNLTFGDADGKTLYITQGRSLGRIRLNIAGALWKPAP